MYIQQLKLLAIMKLLIVIATCVTLFFINGFKPNNQPAAALAKTLAGLTIISCGPVNAGYAAAFTSYRFTPGADLMEKIFINDNRKPAGEMRNGILYLQLETRMGNWYPETEEGQPLKVYAFAEAGKPMQLPGPLIRVPEGTIINAEIHNTIPGLPLILRGFYSRPGNAKDSVSIPFDDTYKVQFKTGKAGTYFYWASDGNFKTWFNGLPFIDDSQLFGAFIVDPPNAVPDPMERIFMIGLWNDTANGGYTNDREELAINGLTWPYTERLNYQNNHPVHWRVINASNQEHPMHLHGFYYTVKSRGNADADTIYKEKERYLSITELLQPHQTISLTWTPKREGNWLFHCHTIFHLMVGSFLRKIPEMTEKETNDINSHAVSGMGGLIMGIHVLPEKNEASIVPYENTRERELTLIVQEKKNYYDTLMGYGFVLREGSLSSDVNASIPGPPIILERGKPVAIKVINHLKEPTTIHWHGLEIESYFDGVAGWGNRGKELAPMILPGDSFVVHMTPPRAGTFMYHTHMHNFQLFQGMYGPLIVIEPGKKYNSETDKIFLAGQAIDRLYNGFLFLNGKIKQDTMALHRGKSYRFRVINITGYANDLTFSVLLDGMAVNWRFLAKDGADLPAGMQVMKPAINQPVSVGQTRDFEFNPRKAGNYLFAVKDYQGSLVLSKVLSVQ
ncbi:hypothetical protein BH10BAC3_BH10BAC3_39900 [soil metagenome]